MIASLKNYIFYWKKMKTCNYYFPENLISMKNDVCGLLLYLRDFVHYLNCVHVINYIQSHCDYKLMETLKLCILPIVFKFNNKVCKNLGVWMFRQCDTKYFLTKNLVLN